jgi:hypothetical protein
VIGLISKHSEATALKEFFELFKTPWECYEPGRAYDLVITTSGEVPRGIQTFLLAIYDSGSTQFDAENGVVALSAFRNAQLEFQGEELPLYGMVQTFEPVGQPLLRHKNQTDVAGLEFELPAYRVVRVGYDLFQEVEFLLSQGQPAQNAHIPTLELHISFLRSVMVKAGVAFVEIPPAPSGYEFMACLTHDVDFTGILEHRFDSTMWGFLYRAIVSSLVAAARGRLAWSRCWTNWKAAFSLPLVYCGWKDDFWLEFDRYVEIEKELGSTFFFIPFKDRPGTREGRPAPSRRGAKYDFSEIAGAVRDLVNHRCEVGLHGIDAWQDAAKAEIEAALIRDVVGRSEIGVRMHWLYFDQESPKALEEAGFSYDSTFGYNDAVGFRAGTAQVFSIPPADSLLELPLTVQDTALFYPGRMHLSESEAMESCRQLMRQLVRYGGSMTVNWHTRSLSPERLWGDFYREFIAETKKHRVWFGTAGQVVEWFRMRRAVRFMRVEFTEESLHLEIDSPPLGSLPPFCLRVHHPKGAKQGASRLEYSEIPWKGEAELTVVPLEHSRV